MKAASTLGRALTPSRAAAPHSRRLATTPALPDAADKPPLTVSPGRSRSCSLPDLRSPKPFIGIVLGASAPRSGVRLPGVVPTAELAAREALAGDFPVMPHADAKQWALYSQAHKDLGIPVQVDQRAFESLMFLRGQRIHYLYSGKRYHPFLADAVATAEARGGPIAFTFAYSCMHQLLKFRTQVAATGRAFGEFCGTARMKELTSSPFTPPWTRGEKDVKEGSGLIDGIPPVPSFAFIELGSLLEGPLAETDTHYLDATGKPLDRAKLKSLYAETVKESMSEENLRHFRGTGRFLPPALAAVHELQGAVQGFRRALPHAATYAQERALADTPHLWRSPLEAVEPAAPMAPPEAPAAGTSATHRSSESGTRESKAD